MGEVGRGETPRIWQGVSPWHEPCNPPAVRQCRQCEIDVCHPLFFLKRAITEEPQRPKRMLRYAFNIL